MESYYAILEIEESATPEEIKNAYRLLLEVWHPDRFHHRPKLLAQAEEKAGKINKAFETLGIPEMRERYDAWLRANRNWNVETVRTVTCPSCQTSFSSNPERSEKREFRPDQHRARKDSGHGAMPHDKEWFTPVRMGMLAIGMLFSGVVVFVITKPSKVIVSYKPARVVEQATLQKNEPVALKEEEQVRQAATVRDGVSSRPTQPNERETLPRNAPRTETQQERLDRLELGLRQRLMAKAPVRAPVSPTDSISAVDLQQLKTMGAQGNAMAQNQLGQLYDNGRRGVPQDYAAALGWYEKAAAQGNGWAQNQLGQMYADGRGLPQDHQKARQWWERAAVQGVAQAQYNLGQLYANGRGVRQDYTTARGWYEKAAAQGNAWAQAQLGQLYANGLGVPKDYTTARGWYEKAAAKGNAWAQAQLALL